MLREYSDIFQKNPEVSSGRRRRPMPYLETIGFTLENSDHLRLAHAHLNHEWNKLISKNIQHCHLNMIILKFTTTFVFLYLLAGLISTHGYVPLRQALWTSEWYHTAPGKHWLRSMKSFSTRSTIKKYLRFEIIIVEKNKSHQEVCLDYTIVFV